MNSNESIIYLKQLTSLGLKKTHINSIVSKTDIFKSDLKQCGYANRYTYNQAISIYIGCELLKLGMSSRHINRVLFAISNYDFKIYISKDINEKLIIFIFLSELTPKQIKRYRGMKSTIIGKNLITGKTILMEDRLRTSSFEIWMMPEKSIKDIYSEVDVYTKINLYRILSCVSKLFNF